MVRGAAVQLPGLFEDLLQTDVLTCLGHQHLHEAVEDLGCLLRAAGQSLGQTLQLLVEEAGNRDVK